MRALLPKGACANYLRPGANHVVHPELEGGLEMVHHTLLNLGYPLREVHDYAEAVRHDHYDIKISSDAEHRSLHELMVASESIEIFWVSLAANSSLAGKSLAEADLRSRTGASVVSLIREGKLTANPKSGTVFAVGDRVGLIGDEEQIAAARDLVSGDALAAQ